VAQQDGQREVAADHLIGAQEAAQPALGGDDLMGALDELSQQLVQLQAWKIRERQRPVATDRGRGWGTMQVGWATQPAVVVCVTVVGRIDAISHGQSPPKMRTGSFERFGRCDVALMVRMTCPSVGAHAARGVPAPYVRSRRRGHRWAI